MPSARLVLEFAEKGYSETKGKVSSLNEHVDKTSGFFKNALSSALGFVGASVIMGGVSLAAGFLTSQVSGIVDAFGEAQQVGAQTNAVLNSTKGISGMTAESVGNLADSLSKMSGIDDEVVQSGENMLLTFTNIHKDTFPAATQAALDMSVALKEDMGSAAMQVGKALQSPVEGVTALQRVGVKLTEDQKKQVESFMKVNDIASAQKIILNELNTEFGGSAKAAGDTLPAAMGKLHTAFGNIQEKVGGAVAPLLLNLSTIVLDKVLPAVDRFGTFLMANIVPALTKFGDFIQSYVIPDLIKLSGWFNEHVVPILVTFWNVIQSDVLPQLESMNRKIMTDLVPALQNLWNKLAPALIPVLQLVGKIISTVVGPALVSFISGIASVINWIANFIGWISHIGDGFRMLGTTVHNIITGISSTISAGFSFIQGIIQGAIDTIVGNFKWLYSHNVYFQQLVDEIISEFNRAKLFVERIVTVIRVTLENTWNSIVNGARSAWKSFTDQIGNALGAIGTAMSAIGDAITKPITDLGSKLEAIGKKLMQKLIDGIKGMAGSVKDAAGDILGGIGGALGFHGLATGGTAPGGPVKLAERGMELVTAPGVYMPPKGSHVYTNSETIDILSNSGSGSKGNTINVYPAQSSLTEDGLAEIQRRVAVLYG
jgi:hypothetical protein